MKRNKLNIVALFLLFLLIALTLAKTETCSHAIKNTIGNIQGYAKCPNCEDSFWWKEFDSIAYSSDGSVGIIICKECFDNPSSLDPDRICNHFTKFGRNATMIAEVRKAVTKYRLQGCVDI
jgi:hypothetical protein